MRGLLRIAPAEDRLEPRVGTPLGEHRRSRRAQPVKRESVQASLQHRGTPIVPERVFAEGALLAGISLQGPFWSLGVYNGSGVGRVKPA